MTTLARIVYISFFSGALALIAVFQDSGWKAPPHADKWLNPYKGKEWATTEGRRVFDKVCWTCHGERGQGKGPGSVGLERKPADFTSEKVQSQTDGALFWKMTEGNPPMASYKKELTEFQRWGLVNYIRVLGKKEKFAKAD